MDNIHNITHTALPSVLKYIFVDKCNFRLAQFSHWKFLPLLLKCNYSTLITPSPLPLNLFLHSQNLRYPDAETNQ